MADVKKVKAINPQIVVHGTLEKPYYEISYYDTTDNQWHIGYSSYDLYIVKEYLDNYFEIIEADVEPVKHGEWHKWENTMNSKTLGVFCSICHSCSDNMTDFCPNCGAKMEIVR